MMRTERFKKSVEFFGIIALGVLQRELRVTGFAHEDRNRPAQLIVARAKANIRVN
ncbi:MAG: hypothetical protein HC767_14905 [Akkermansiaceae bacterium]|nr:hypothetical protein [Akkermansiaceae bacterium]